MHRSRLSPLAAVAAVAVLASCGSSAAKPAAAPPARPKLALNQATGDEARAALYPVRPVHYVLDGTLADLGGDAPVYRLVGHVVTQSDVARIADVLGVHAAPTRTDWGYEVRDGDALLSVETNGGTTWLDYSSAGNAGVAVGGSIGSSGSGGAAVPPDAPKNPDAPVGEEPPTPLPTTPPPVDLPSADDATRIAQRLLDDLGVLDGQQWAHDVSDTSTAGVAVSCAPGTPCPPTPDPVISERTVNYALRLDGAELPDVGWNVTVGSHAAVEAVSGTWATPEQVGTYPLRSTADVFADLQQGRAQFVGAQALAAGAAETARDDGGATAQGADTGAEPDAVIAQDVTITGVSGGRARWDGTADGQPAVYIVPTYRFDAHVSGQPSYDVELLALDPAGFSIAAPAPAPTPEPVATPEPATAR
jgi:hypothetical protein